jgi:Putative SAM-dependent methyltransferase
MTYGAIGFVLNSLDEAGCDEHGEDWDDLLKARLDSLEKSYKELRVRDRVLIDYSDLSMQAAYLFMYAIGRAEFTYQILEQMSAESGGVFFKDGHLRISSIGGGPGSELAGLIKFLESDACTANVTSIAYRVFDKEGNWRHIVEALRDALETNIKIELIFEKLDVEDAQSCLAKTLQDDDFIVMSFFISEVCEIANRNSVITSLNHLLGTVSEGSHLFYNDSDAYSFYTFMNARAASARRYVQRVEVQETIVVRNPQFDGVFESMIERLDKTPHLNSKAVAKLFRRDG